MVEASLLALLAPTVAFEEAKSEKSRRTRAAPAAVNVGPCSERFAASFLLAPDVGASMLRLPELLLLLLLELELEPLELLLLVP